MSSAAQHTIRCSHCGADVPVGFRHCDECGTPLARVCASCGQTNRAAAKFCGACGSALDVAPPPVEEQTPPPPTKPTRPASPPVAETLESERKLVTVMFADVRGSMELIRELDPEDAALLLEPAIKAMVDGVRQFGGTVNRVQGDGVMALFGAPIAREDHAERACLAAMQILRTVPRVANANVLVRIGINSGEVLVQRNLNDMTLDYDAIGAAAHIANRLEQAAAPNTAVISAQTMRLAGGAIRVNALGKLTLKGLAEQLEAYELVSASGRRDRWRTRAQVRPLSPFVGRETEIATLDRVKGRAMTGQSQVAIVIGEPGTGKSRLLHEFMGTIGPRMTTLRSGASPFDQDRPFASVADLVRACLAAILETDDAPPDDGVAAIAGGTEISGPAIESALRFVLGQPIDDAAWAALDTTARRERIVQAVRRAIFTVTGGRPLLLIFEDLHWADSESRVILERVMESARAGPVMILATARPEYVPATLRSHTTVLRLQALDREEADELLVKMLGDSGPLAELRRLLISKTEGTPLFIEETLQMLFDSGTLIQRNGVELTRPLADILIPDSVQAVIAARIDTLPQPTRTTLQIASVIGRDVPVLLLAKVAGVTPGVLERQLLQLADAEFLYEADLPAGRSYTFKHVLIQAVAYVTMLARRRRQLHGEILAALETEHAGHLDDVADRLGEHAEKGQQYEKAAHYLATAGRRANAMGAHHTAVNLIDRTLTALEAIPRTPLTAAQGIDARLALRVALGGARVDLPLLIKRLDEAEELAVEIGDTRRHTQIAISQCNILVLMGEIERALTVGTAALTSAIALDDAVLRTSARFALGQAHTFGGALDEAVSTLEAGLTDLAHPGSRTVTGTTGTPVVLYLCCLTIAHSLGGNFDNAHRHGDAALDFATQTGRRYDISYANLAKGVAFFVQGRAEEAGAHLADAHRICHEAEIAVLKPSVARFFGLAEARAGRGHMARQILREASQHAAAGGANAFDAWCRASLAEAALIDGDVSLALETSAAALKDARRLKIRPVEAHALRVLAEASGRTGTLPPVEVTRMLAEALRIAQQAGMRPEVVACHAAAARHMTLSGEHDSAAHAESTAEALARSIGIVYLARRHGTVTRPRIDGVEAAG
ncbi:MAG TPA: adenylate/guanylate cyclase domain-containing protein [Acetobacteraceae bacterium]|nr:adenylate/guanylate cyclase domain-containing protein [Acetobacteraceae bacterium]